MCRAYAFVVQISGSASTSTSATHPFPLSPSTDAVEILFTLSRYQQHGKVWQCTKFLRQGFEYQWKELIAQEERLTNYTEKYQEH